MNEDSDNARDRKLAEAARRVVASHQPYRPGIASQTFTVTVGFNEWLALETLAADRG